MPLDMSKYLALFVTEAGEHLDALARDLVRVEREGAGEAVDSVFRHAHSVKGMAASMGFEQIAVLAHRVEDLVDQVRKQPAVMTPEVGDTLLAASDQLQAMVRAVGAGEPAPDASGLISSIADRLKALTGAAPSPTKVLRHEPSAAPSAPSAPPPPPTCAPANGAEVPLAAEAPRATVRVRLSPSCQVPGVRAFLVHKKVGAVANIFAVQPPLEDLRAGRIPEGWLRLDIELSSPSGMEAVRKALSTVADLEAIELTPVVPAEAPPPPRPPEASAEAQRLAAEAPKTVRVKTEILDFLLDVAGELILSTARLRELTKGIPESHQGPVAEGVDRLHAIVKDLHAKVMSVRMTPLALITDRLPRAARDLARKRNREVELVVTGADIELDRAILDELADPLVHLLRNCIDHGIEDPEARAAAGKPPRGRISVLGRRDRDRVVVELEDDGKGMDVARLKAVAVERGLITAQTAAEMSDREAFLLSCLPGVSTAQSVTDVSGRGVGMDAVKRAVESVGGSLEIASSPGRGTCFRLRLPLTVAVVNVLLVQVGAEVFGLPIGKVKAVVDADPAGLEAGKNAPLLPYAGGLLPVHALGDLLRVPRAPRAGVRPHVVVEADAGQVALEVDRLVGHEEAVLKPLSHPLDLIPGLAGATILGSGRPIFILDAPRLVGF